jgi:hypothetical protein
MICFGATGKQPFNFQRIRIYLLARQGIRGQSTLRSIRLFPDAKHRELIELRSLLGLALDPVRPLTKTPGNIFQVYLVYVAKCGLEVLFHSTSVI